MTESTDSVDPEWGHFRTIMTFAVIAYVIICFSALTISAFSEGKLALKLETINILFTSSTKYILFQVALCYTLMGFASYQMTYRTIHEYFFYFEMVVGGMIAFETMIVWLFASLKSLQTVLPLIGFRFIVDSILLSSIFIHVTFDGRQTWFNFNYLASLRIVYLWRSYTVSLSAKSVSITLLTVVIMLFSFIYFSALTQRSIENISVRSSLMFDEDMFNIQNFLGNIDESLLDEFPVSTYDRARELRSTWTFLSCIYFIFNCVSTLGYGDLCPSTICGQMWSIVVVLVGVACFAESLSLLIAYFRSPSADLKYVLRYGVHHIVIAGNFPAQMARDFLNELYHEDHDDSVKDLDTLILFEDPLTRKEVLSFLKAHVDKFSGRVLDVAGTLMDARDICTHFVYAAKAVFIFPSLYSHDQVAEDLGVATRVFALRQTCPFVRIICLVFGYEYGRMLIKSGLNEEDVLMLDEFKLSLLGKSCSIWGFSTFISNLFCSVSAVSEFEELDPWESEYRRGMDSEIYMIPLSSGYQTFSFENIFFDVVKRSEGKVLLIGIVCKKGGQFEKPKITLFPERKSKPFSMVGDEQLPIGIFLGPNLESVVQKELEERVKGSNLFKLEFDITSALRPLTGPGDYPDPKYILDSSHTQAPVRSEIESNILKAEAVLKKVKEVRRRYDDWSKRKTAVGKVRKTSKSHYEVFKDTVRASNPDAPPSKMLCKGGHVLLCAYSTNGETLGLRHFVQLLRANDMEACRPVVVLCPSIPKDWEYVLHNPEVYFVLGTPSELFSLQRASYRNAHTIVLLQSGGAATRDPTIVDAGQILSARLIDGNTQNLYVIADLLFEVNIKFCPSIKSMAVLSERDKNARQSRGAADSDASDRLTVSSLFGGAKKIVPLVEGETGAPDPKHKATFACGRILVASGVITSLLVNVMFNRSIVQVIKELLFSKMLIFETDAMVGQKYSLVLESLFRAGMLPLALLRNMDSTGMDKMKRDKNKLHSGCVFVFTAPSGDDEIIVGDSIMCLLEQGAESEFDTMTTR